MNPFSTAAIYGPKLNAPPAIMPTAVIMRSRITQKTAATTTFRRMPNLRVPGCECFAAKAKPHLEVYKECNYVCEDRHSDVIRSVQASRCVKI